MAPVAHPGGGGKPHIYQRFLAHPLQSLATRNSSLSLAATCFEAKLTILEPELTDQRDFTLVVANERGLQTGIIRLRVASPLSPMLMISSAFVTICGLFLLSLVIIFLLKRRHGSAAANLQNGGSSGQQSSGEKNGVATIVAGSVEHLVNGSGNGAVNGTNGLLQHAHQTRGIVNGAGNGLANGASNPGAGNSNGSAADHHNHLMSMASSDTSGDQKQLLTNLSSSSSADRNSPAGSASGSGLTSNTNALCVDFNVTSSGGSNSGAGHSSSSSHSTPSPLNHISVEHDFHPQQHHHHLDHQLDRRLDGSTYRPAESVTNDAELSPRSPLGCNGGSALIYANLEYSDPQPAQQQQQRIRQQVPADFSLAAQSPTGSSTSSIDSRRLHQSSIRRSTAKRDSLTGRTGGTNNNDNNNHHSSSSSHLPSPQGRPSVGATIAMMNSLAAAAAAATTNNPTSLSSPPTEGVLNGAIQQQLASSKQLRKPGPPKPPKPSIQQRSRFYQQQAAVGSHGGGLANGGENNTGGLVMIGSAQQQMRPASESLGGSQATAATATNDQLAVEYSRIAFPARAEL